MKKEDVIVIGAGGHAKIVIDILEETGCYNIVGLIAKDNEGKLFYGYPILGDDDALPTYFKKGITCVAIGVGGFKNNVLRKNIFERLNSLGFCVISAIHPKAVISKTAELGDGNVVFAGVVINPDVEIGDNCIIATGATIDHETVIESHVLISAGVTVGGCSVIEEGALCALGSKVISGVKVGKNALVAAGAVVVSDIAPDSTVFGIPARAVKR